MQINFTGHHIEVTDALRAKTTQKFDRLTKHFDKIMSIDVTFEVEKLRQIIKATIHVAGKTFHANSESEDMYSSIDNLVDKLDRQLKEHKKQQTEH